ncbi:hypothetical protein [uncultured Nostoc sp.]|uniref:hypothetical protein n=1 Tax=uncultured Nostoc sp. TaxID=340711 RepID=UPI00261A10D5|nr:hypothetical protein [uncultured Nostoc sp.]
MTTVTATQTATTHDRTHGLQTIQVLHRRSLYWKHSFPLKSLLVRIVEAPHPLDGVWGRQTRTTVTRLQPRMNIGHNSIFILGCFGC